MPWFESFDAVVSHFPDMEVLHEEAMSRHTTFRIGGPARRFARPANQEQLAQLLALGKENGWPMMVIGNGSNLLVADDGLDFLVIYTGRLDVMAQTGKATLRAGAGVSLARLANFAQNQGLGGLEFAHGIPGSLGGAVYMNAGAYGGEICQVVASVTAWFPDEGVIRLDGEALEFGYRHSVFSHRTGAVLEVEFALEPEDSAAIRARTDALDRRRREKQPLELPSAGSTFKRPEGHFAGALIEQCGLKGFRIGGAQVSEKHAGFIVNTGGATGEDVCRLIAHVRQVVLARTGVALDPEIKIVP